MAYDTRAFLADLDRAGQLHRVTAPVSRELEITEIYDRVVKAGGPALLFENVEGSTMPLLINQFGTWERMRMALGREPEAIGEDLVAFTKLKPPKGFRQMWRTFRKVRELLAFPPKRVRRGKCQEVVHTADAVDLTQLPVITCWPEDAGPFITLPQVYTRDPETGERNMGMYRMQVFDKRTTGLHWQTHKTGRTHYDKARAMGLDRMPVAVALGGDPILTYGATAPLPPGFDEVMFCGYMRGKRVRMVRCKTVDLEVPADAEIVLEGYVDLHEPMRTEGPFGDHTGYYSLADAFPALHVTAVTHRKDAVYPTTVVGIPPQEDGPMGKATERLFLPLIRLQIPELVEMNMPEEGAFHNLMLVSIKKRYPGHARKAMMSLWGAGMIALEKIIVVFDEDVDITDAWQAFATHGARLDIARDLLLIDQVPTDTLDHAAPVGDLGSHLGVDLTRPLPGEPARRETTAAEVDLDVAALTTAHPAIRRVVLTEPTPAFAAVTVDKQAAGIARDVVQALWAAGLPDRVIPIVFEDDIDPDNAAACLFHATANLDPARDLIFDAAPDTQRTRVGVDATLKWPEENAREWPPLIVMTHDVKARVRKRWDEFGFSD